MGSHRIEMGSKEKPFVLYTGDLGAEMIEQAFKEALAMEIEKLKEKKSKPMKFIISGKEVWLDYDEWIAKQKFDKERR